LQDDLGTIWDSTPDLVDLTIRYRDTAIGPVDEAMQTPQPAQIVSQSVNHHESTGLDTMHSSGRDIVRLWVRDM
jgi:hypothetical protein